MYRVSPSTPPEVFRLTVDAEGLADVLADTAPAGLGSRQLPAPGTGPWLQSRQLAHLRDINRWWDHWMPVAATGWGALVLILPLMLVQFFVAAVRGPR